MLGLKNIIDFSSDGEYLAYSSPDGCLKIWETSTNILAQEYTPSSHLSATCSSLSWSPNTHISHPSKRPKKSKDGSSFSTIKDLQLIAMGTLTGDVLLYSFRNADLHSCLSNGHTKVINDICWCVSTCSLYSCSSDKNITTWDIFTGNVKMKWKADDVPVHSLCLIDSNNLLSASNSIKWWNIKEKTIIKTFAGHASEVSRLLSLINGEKVESSYILSAAVGDKIINAWQLNEDNSKRAVASFIVSDEPESISVSTQKDGHTFMSVVCKDGSLHLFEHVLNGRKKKPIKSKFCIQIASKSTESHSKPQRVPVMCATLTLGLNSCLLSYRSFLKPIFERIDLTEVSTDLFLVRNISLCPAGSQENDVSRVKHTNKSEAVKLLVPGYLMPAIDVQSTPRKRKKKGDEEESPIEERLRALDLSKIPPNVEEPALKADSMVHLLLQGLQSKDKSLLNTVLHSNDEKIIQNTIERLPLPSIRFLIKEFRDRLRRKEGRNRSYLKWIKGLISVHFSYMFSGTTDISEQFNPIQELVVAKGQSIPKLGQITGALGILISQTFSSNVNDVESDEPLAVYLSESSEESESEDHSVNSDDDDEEEEELQNVSFEDSSSSESASENEMDL